MRRTTGSQQGARSQRVIQDVLAATVDQLAAGGFGALSIDGVARAAGVHRTTIYRRWPSKLHLIRALLEHQSSALDTVPIHDDLATELRALLDQLARNLATPEGKALAQIMASGDPELQPLAEAARARALSRFRAAFERAGDHPSEAIEMQTHVVFYSAIHWLIDPAREASPATLERLLATTLPGVFPARSA